MDAELDPRGAQKVKYVRRLMVFLATRMVAVCIIAALMTVVFYLAMNTTNMYIVLKEGLNTRVGVVLKQVDEEELQKFYTRDFLQTDLVLQSVANKESPYQHYTIRSYDHRVTLSWVWCWPWENEAVATVTERVPKIEGELPRDKMTDAQRAATKGKLLPPSWRGGKYEVEMVKMDGVWKIASIVTLEVLLEPTPEPTPIPTVTPEPAGSDE